MIKKQEKLKYTMQQENCDIFATTERWWVTQEIRVLQQMATNSSEETWGLFLILGSVFTGLSLAMMKTALSD